MIVLFLKLYVHSIVEYDEVWTYLPSLSTIEDNRSISNCSRAISMKDIKNDEYDRETIVNILQRAKNQVEVEQKLRLKSYNDYGKLTRKKLSRKSSI